MAPPQDLLQAAQDLAPLQMPVWQDSCCPALGTYSQRRWMWDGGQSQRQTAATPASKRWLQAAGLPASMLRQGERVSWCGGKREAVMPRARWGSGVRQVIAKCADQ